MAGAPQGNTNATDGRIWRAAIRRALEKRSQVDKIDALERIAEALIEKALEKDVPALRELGDRLEGKANQTISGEGGGPIIIQASSLDESI